MKVIGVSSCPTTNPGYPLGYPGFVMMWKRRDSKGEAVRTRQKQTGGLFLVSWACGTPQSCREFCYAYHKKMSHFYLLNFRAVVI